jgi:sugar lactone lactonase YvrE
MARLLYTRTGERWRVEARRSYLPKGRRVRTTLIIRAIAVAAVSAAAIGMAAGSSTAATLTVSNPRILVHYDLSSGQEPENVTVEPDGNLDVVLARAHQIERVTPAGQRQLLATLPAPPDGGIHTPVLGFALATGIVRTSDGTLYVGYAAGDENFTGIWRIRPGGQPERIVALSADSFPNGLALDETTGLLYLADSTMATIWRVPLSGGPRPRGPAARCSAATSGWASTGSRSTMAPSGPRTRTRTRS